MATNTAELHDVARQSESTNGTLAIARQTATTETNSRPTSRDDRQLDAYGEQWRSLQRESLELRWQIGNSCNAALGGSRASRDIAGRIGCGLPDLHLMMWFARLVPDLNAFLDEHPAACSWGKARKVIAQLNPNRVTRKRSALGKLIGQIKKLASQHREGNVAFEKKEVDKLSSILLRFTLALENSSKPADAAVEENE